VAPSIEVAEFIVAAPQYAAVPVAPMLPTAAVVVVAGGSLDSENASAHVEMGAARTSRINTG